MKNKSDLRLVVVGCLGTMAMEAAAFEVKPTGRLHLDYAVHDADATPLDDNFLVRRARIGLEGKFNDAWSFEIVYDFADDGAASNVYLRYDGWKPSAFTFGQFKVPFGLEEQTSSNNITFIERALPGAAFAPSRRLGVGFDLVSNSYTLAAMGFGQSIDGDEGRGAAVRATFTPLNQDDTVVHLGLAITTERPNGEIRFSARPESRPTDVRLVRTSNLDDVRRIDQLGLEAAWKTGPFSAQMEWMRSDVSRSAGRPDVDFHGWYIAGSWVLTGESRGYRDGVFRGVSPSKPGGAWELTARYSHLNLDDGAVLGGKESNFTLGLNWYANDYLRLMANYIKVSSDRRGEADDPNIFLVRAQIAF